MSTNTIKDPAAMLAALLSGDVNALTGTPITGEEVDFHDGPKIILPRQMTYERAFKILKRLQEEAETPTSFQRKFLFRPDDGAYAALQVIKQRWGMLLGKTTETFFGMMPAETRDIAIGVNKRVEVPWGRIEIPVLQGLEMYLGETRHRDYGSIFQIQAMGPRKHKDEVEAFFNDIEVYLKENSIYRGHALVGSDNPEFLDLKSFRPEQIVFSDEVTKILNGTLFAPLRHTPTMRREGIPLKRALLLHGPYGTGKTSAGQLTALEAVAHGWTFISAKPGRDKVEDVLRTARLYQPAVVFVEDIDISTGSGESDEVSKFLDAFDGITAKGGELVAVMTTNHIERIHKGMLRPGRLDAVVEIASLDRNGVERLIRAVVAKGKLAEGVDFDKVYEAMAGFFPAFVREALTRAVTFAIDRLNGSSDYVIDTEDLVYSAHSLKPQLDALHSAGEGSLRPRLEGAFVELIENTLSENLQLNYSGDRIDIEKKAEGATA